MHGPYWFAYWKAGGRTRCRYVGSDARASVLLAMHARAKAASKTVAYRLGGLELEDGEGSKRTVGPSSSMRGAGGSRVRARR